MNNTMQRRPLILLLSTFFLGFPLVGAVISGVIQPNGITLAPNQQQQFTLPGYNQNVLWSVQPAGTGTITSTGLYTSPGGNGVAFIYAQPTVGGPSFVSVVYLTPGSGSISNTPTPPTGTGISGTGTTGTGSTVLPYLGGSSYPSLGPLPSAPTLSPSPLQPVSPSSPAPGAPTAVSISISPAWISLQAGQSIVFSAAVQGTFDQQTQWSISPNLGTISNGYYTAPSSFSNESQVTISATSLADPTKTATATVLLSQQVASVAAPLSNVTVTIAPGPKTLAAGQSALFTATVQGAPYPSVLWSVIPNVGTMVNGLYTAPSTIASQEPILLTAASAADPGASTTVSLILEPGPSAASPPPQSVSVTLLPGTVSLNGGQSTTFTPTVSGTTNTDVTWSINPQVGTITNGVYQAPGIIASQQTVTVTATSVADSTKAASAAVRLYPVGVTVGPATISLGAGKTTTFTASVTGTSNTAVSWSASPALGTIGMGYTLLPPRLALLRPLPSQRQAPRIDQVGNRDGHPDTHRGYLQPNHQQPDHRQPAGHYCHAARGSDRAERKTSAVSVTIPVGTNLAGQLQLAMTIHGLRSDSEASVQVNNSAWLPISTGNVTLLGNAAAYGGIGGGFHTLQMTMNLPAGAVTGGSNTITFRFNQTDGRVSGFRVLAFNIQTSSGTLLIPASTFVQDDPNTWQPPSTLASDISAGQTLWRTAALSMPNAGGVGRRPSKPTAWIVTRRTDAI